MLLPESQRLLKANAVRELGTRVAFNFEDLRQQGDAYLANIRQEAESLLAAAHRDAAAIRETARKEALDAGRREGLKESGRMIEAQAAKIAQQQLAQQLETTLPAVASISQAMRQELDHWLVRWEETALRTAVAIAGKILRRELEAKPEIAAGMIAETLRLAAGHPQLRVHLHPEEIAQLGTHAEDVVRTMTACADAVLVPDPQLTRGSCRIETRHGEIDARLETMLDRVVEELLA